MAAWKLAPALAVGCTSILKPAQQTPLSALRLGKMILQAAAGNPKKVSLELGGKAPNIVLKDMDVQTAIAGAAHAIFFNQGQVCCAGSRLYVEKGVFDQVVEGVAEHAKKIKIGS